jgi:putative nucleotidyltransferase with HDIG domain
MSVVEDTTHGSVRYLPHAVAATATVTLAPAALVWGIAVTGVVTGFVALLAIGLVVSLLVAYGGRVLWQVRPGSRDLLFSDLMLWGWLRRWRLEGHLSNAVALLGLDTKGVRERSDELDPETQIKALRKLATALEARDPYTHGHSRRVARYSTMIAKKLGVPAPDVAKIRLAAAVHDVGKLVVPLAILNKPGRLTDEEFEVIKRHAPVGAEMVSRIGDDELTQIVAHHHERLDGSGYPSRLFGSEIPLGARIIAVADTFDALTSTRAYRPAKRHRDVFRILREEAGTQLDPLAVQAFSRCYSGFWGIGAWSIVSGAPQRVLFPLGSQAPVAGGTLTAKALAVLAATAATGSFVTGSLTDPRDTSADPTGAPALAAVGAGAYGAEYAGPERRSAELPARADKQGENQSKGGPGNSAEKGGSRSDEQDVLPDSGTPPHTDATTNPGSPGSNAEQLVEQQLERRGGQSGQLWEQSEQLVEQLGEQSGQLRQQSGQVQEQLGQNPAQLG